MKEKISRACKTEPKSKYHYQELEHENKQLKKEAVFKTNESCKKISEIEGIGIMTATAILAAIGDPKVFKNSRNFSAFLGLVPKQFSSGNKQVSLGISKRGDTYIRTLLIHGTRNVVRYVGSKEDRKSKWIRQLKER